MGPVAFLNHLKGLLAIVAPFWPVISSAFGLTGMYEIFQDQSASNELIKFICSLGLVGNKLCEDGSLMGIAGYDPEELEPEFFNMLLGHYPAGSARKNGDHYYQVVKRQTFGQFDYGSIGNLERYGSADAPDYDLSKVAMPVVILSAKNDYFSTLEDVSILKNKLPNVVLDHVMERKEFNHIDYVVGKNINVYINPLLKSLLEKYSDLD